MYFVNLHLAATAAGLRQLGKMAPV